MYRNLVCLLASLLLPINSFAEVNVLVTIKPLQLIAAAILDGAGTITLLMPANSSPHHYSLTPSDRIAIENADLIVYIGEALETQFASIMKQVGPAKNSLELINLNDLKKLPLDADDHRSTATKVENGERVDPHIWLSTENARVMAVAIRDALVQIDSGSASGFDENLGRFESRLDSLATWSGEKLQMVEHQPYIVYHNSIHYFEDQFGLEHNLVLVDDTEVPPGIRHILDTRRAIEDIQPACLFTDNNVNLAIVRTMLAGNEITTVKLDLLGANISGAQGYAGLMENLVNDFVDCF